MSGFRSPDEFNCGRSEGGLRTAHDGSRFGANWYGLSFGNKWGPAHTPGPTSPFAPEDYSWARSMTGPRTAPPSITHSEPVL